MSENHKYVQSYDSPIGNMSIVASDMGITSISLRDRSSVSAFSTAIVPNVHTHKAISQLGAYFAGDLMEFDLALDWRGYSDFYQSVWTYLLAIPYGQTRSYLDIAQYLDKPGASRAVGLANGKNPIPIIVPCHRVIGSNGKLTGYALGLNIKQQLLSHENPSSFACQGELF